MLPHPRSFPFDYKGPRASSRCRDVFGGSGVEPVCYGVPFRERGCNDRDEQREPGCFWTAFGCACARAPHAARAFFGCACARSSCAAFGSGDAGSKSRSSSGTAACSGVCSPCSAADAATAAVRAARACARADSAKHSRYAVAESDQRHEVRMGGLRLRDGPHRHSARMVDERA